MQASIIVPFRQANLLLINHESQPFVPMKPVVEGMGLSWQGQHAKLSSGRFASTIKEILIVAEDGKQRQMTCLPLRKLPGWLMSIHPNKVKPELRDNIIAYQNECDDVLWSYWNDGIAVRNDSRTFDTVIYTTIGTDGLTVLSNLVAGKVNHLTRQNQRRATMKLWAQVQAAFNVRSVEDLPADQLNEARTFIAAYVLEGEYLGKEEAPKKPEPIPEPPAVQGIVLNEEDFYNFCLLMLKFRMLYRIFELHLFQGLQQLCSKIFDPLAKNFHTADRAAIALEKRFGPQIAAVERLLEADK